MLSRRRFIQAGIGGGAILLVIRAAYGPFSADPEIAEDREFAYAVLGPKEQTILRAVAPVILAGALPDEPVERQRALLQVIRGVDTAVSGLPPAVQDELAQLFALLGFPVTRRLLAGVKPPWLQASSVQIASFLDSWRASRFALLRGAYRALQELTMAAWYGNEASWSRIGYPGPPALAG